MERTRLGKSDLEVSRICLGTMNFGWTCDEEASFAVLDAYVEAGGNFLDSANIYSRWAPGHKGGESEEIIGRWLKARGNRDQVVVATKVRGRMWGGPDGEGLHRKHIISACNGSLKRLGVETIDLYQSHSPDDKTPIEETLRTFEDLVRDGKVQHVGCSNYAPERLAEALDVAEQAGIAGYISLQPHHSLVHRSEYEAELAAICVAREVGVIPYSPLGAGFLTGKYAEGGAEVQSARSRAVRQYFTPDGWAVLGEARVIAGARGTTVAAIALAWSLRKPGITAPIIGANSPAQLADLLPALEVELSHEDMTRLESASEPFAREGSTRR